LENEFAFVTVSMPGIEPTITVTVFADALPAAPAVTAETGTVTDAVNAGTT
jgi:hypothetical protein